MKVTYIGHATLLVELGTVRLLTDPNFDRKLGGFLPRVAPPGISIDRLPKLDALLLTHAHADHLSFDSLDALPRDIPLYAPPVIAKWLRRRGYSHAEDLAPGNTTRIGNVDVHAALATHSGNRYGFDRWRAAANMYLLDAATESIAAAEDRIPEPVDTGNSRENIVTGMVVSVSKDGFIEIGHWTDSDARGRLRNGMGSEPLSTESWRDSEGALPSLWAA